MTTDDGRDMATDDGRDMATDDGRNANDTRRAVLSALGDGPVSGPDLADHIGVSRTAVWKAVEALREEGFGIDSGSNGYVLTGIPEYGAAAVEYRLDRDGDVEYHESIQSTNARARELAVSGATPDRDVPQVVLADEQTGGRGRLDREWVSPPGGVWMSVLIRPDLPPARVPLVTLAAAVATARAVDAVADADVGGASVGLKWPNDVLAVDRTGAERKLAGILTEMDGEADEVSWVVVGIGVNANVDAGALPAGATSLRERAGDVNRGRLVAELLGELDALRSEPGDILPAWRDLSATLGRQVRVETGGDPVVGEATDIAPPGRLRIDTDGGGVWVHAGDCEHLRPVDGGR
jgi:BirA family biotin operon repressor/biotin-[acetyl-CoA-carboxylase] ligase